MMYEFAISAGEGTLIAYGTTDDKYFDLEYLEDGETFILGPCADDCETGQ